MSRPNLDEVAMRSTIEAVLCRTLINAPINEDMIREVLLAAAAVASLGGNPAAWLSESNPRVPEEMERLRPHVNPDRRGWKCTEPDCEWTGATDEATRDLCPRCLTRNSIEEVPA